MLFLLAFFCGLIYAYKHGSIVYWLIFQVVIMLAISCYIIADIDVLYKVDVGLISDTRLYYENYMGRWENLKNELFADYPYSLRIFTYPWINALYATWGQSVLSFFLLDVIIKNKRNLLFFIFFHALIYTSTNLFKDNLILSLGLLGYIVLKYLKNIWLQCGVVIITFMVIARIRPFIGYAIPLGLFPLLFRIKSLNVKRFLLLLGLFLVIGVLYSQKDFILGVMNSLSGDSSAGTRSNPIVALMKIFLGPTPLHYLHSQRYFEQPFLVTQSYFYSVLHYLYYIALSFFCMYVIDNWKDLIDVCKMHVAKAFVLFLGLIQLVVYMIIYGSADIRQRGVIITFILVYCLADAESIFKRKLTYNNMIVFIGVFFFLNLLIFTL